MVQILKLIKDLYFILIEKLEKIDDYFHILLISCLTVEVLLYGVGYFLLDSKGGIVKMIRVSIFIRRLGLDYFQTGLRRGAPEVHFDSACMGQQSESCLLQCETECDRGGLQRLPSRILPARLQSLYLGRGGARDIRS